ncbi:histone-lysine N-methyltransferase ASHR3 [Primulina eburnea]|uniref:histone-lysine N-methyltransferase ASHR3 n=1 Tax=Primulina eburnea TaxID=1245227 RepID=UPI003C6C4664
MPDLANFLGLNQPSLPSNSPLPEIKFVSDLNLSATMELCQVQRVDSTIECGHTQLAEPIDDSKREAVRESGERRRGGERGDLNPCRVGPTTAKHIEDWRKRKIEQGVPEFKCSLPFLVGAPPLAKCRVCQNLVYPEEKVLCSVRGCQGVFHLTCARESLGFSSSKQFKCPQHACFLCKQRNHIWRCVVCPIASHDKCSPFPENVFHFPDRPGKAICWRHPSDWRLEMKREVPANNIEDIFTFLPLPHVPEEFKIDIKWKDQRENKSEPPPYVHIKRNVYLFKRKHQNVGTDTGCTSCSSTQCSEACVCRVQSISCSKACRCSEKCANRPFRKEKKIQLVKTELCGWGVVAAESICKGDFVVEYVGEVINDAMCEERLWAMKDQDAKNFYMCEISKDFVIDATFKGNYSRFLNHSCGSNCLLEKWQVDGETRVGVFASRPIQVGESLTYDYRFVQFGPEVECHCRASKCRRYLGTKRRIKIEISWGLKGRRSTRRARMLMPQFR